MTQGQPAKRISGVAYQALREALCLVFWYKPSLEKYLRVVLRDNPEILDGIDFRAKKREVSDAVVDRLVKKEHKYQHTTVQLMLEIANMTSFPELESHEDSSKWLPKAQAAVKELKRCTAPYESLLSSRERHESERAAYVQQLKLQRRFVDELNDLRDQFLAMHQMEDVHKRGRQFEGFLNSLFALFDLDPRLSYSLETEQIDGAISFDTDDYIVEAKWTKNAMSREKADAFAMKVGRKGKNALGLVVSISGLSAPAITAFSRETPFMTVDGADLFSILDGRASLDDVLRRKKRHANETGECYFPVSSMFP